MFITIGGWTILLSEIAAYRSHENAFGQLEVEVLLKGTDEPIMGIGSMDILNSILAYWKEH